MIGLQTNSELLTRLVATNCRLLLAVVFSEWHSEFVAADISEFVAVDLPCGPFE